MKKVGQPFPPSNFEWPWADGGFVKGYTHALTYWREILEQFNALRNQRGRAGPVAGRHG
jgi:hypothetical protein